MVKLVQVNIGEKLAGQVPDRHPDFVADAVDDPVDHIQCVRAGNALANDPLQCFVMNGWEIFFNVAFEAIDAAPATRGVAQKTRCALDAGQNAHSHAAGVTVINHGSLKNRLDDVAKGVMDDAVPERQGRDQAFFRLVNGKKVVSARPIGFPDQMILDVNQVVRPAAEVAQHMRSQQDKREQKRIDGEARVRLKRRKL